MVLLCAAHVRPASRGPYLPHFASFPDLPGKGGGKEAAGWAGSCLFSEFHWEDPETGAGGGREGRRGRDAEEQ